MNRSKFLTIFFVAGASLVSAVSGASAATKVTQAPAAAATVASAAPATPVKTPAAPATPATPAKTAATPASAAAKPVTQAQTKVSINAGSKTALLKLPIVGKSMANAIIAGRPYKDFSQLEAKLAPKFTLDKVKAAEVNLSL